MRKSIIIFLFLISSLIVFSVTFKDIYNLKLDSIRYKNSVLSYKNSEISMNKTVNIFSPDVSVNMDTITINQDGLVPVKYSLSLNCNILNILGFKAGANLPFSIDNMNLKYDLSTTALSISRNIKYEDTSSKMLAKASFLDTSYTLKNTENDLFIETAEDIFNKDYLVKYAGIINEEISLLKDQMQVENDEQKKEDIKLSLMRTENSLRMNEINLKKYKHETNQKLADETVSILNEITGKHKNDIFLPEKRDDLEAAKYYDSSSEMKKILWFLPFIPDITVSLKYSAKWSISFSFGLKIFDSGERDIDSMRRQNYIPNYNEKLKTICDSIESMKLEIERSEIDLIDSENRLLELKNRYDKSLKFYEKNLISKNALKTLELTLKKTNLETEKKKREFLIKKLKLLQIYGINFRGEPV